MVWNEARLHTCAAVADRFLAAVRRHWGDGQRCRAGHRVEMPPLGRARVGLWEYCIGAGQRQAIKGGAILPPRDADGYLPPWLKSYNTGDCGYWLGWTDFSFRSDNSLVPRLTVCLPQLYGTGSDPGSDGKWQPQWQYYHVILSDWDAGISHGNVEHVPVCMHPLTISHCLASLIIATDACSTHFIQGLLLLTLYQ